MRSTTASRARLPRLRPGNRLQLASHFLCDLFPFPVTRFPVGHRTAAQAQFFHNIRIPSPDTGMPSCVPTQPPARQPAPAMRAPYSAAERFRPEVGLVTGRRLVVMSRVHQFSQPLAAGVLAQHEAGLGLSGAGPRSIAMPAVPAQQGEEHGRRGLEGTAIRAVGGAACPAVLASSGHSFTVWCVREGRPGGVLRAAVCQQGGGRSGGRCAGGAGAG